jgi:hypothetical protein
MNGIAKSFEIILGAKVRIELGEIGNPIPGKAKPMSS